MSKYEFYFIYFGIIVATLSLGWVYFQTAQMSFKKRTPARVSFVFFSLLFLIPFIEAEGFLLYSAYFSPFIFALSEYLLLLFPLLCLTGFMFTTFIYFLLILDIENKQEE
jgi:hypothetical protein